jgi:hypothetical protein
MRRKKRLFLGFVVIAIVVIFTMTGCDLFATPEFPSEFLGTWKRENSTFTDTRTFTKDTYRMSNQSNHWVLIDISGDTYHLSQSDNRDHKVFEIIRFVNGKLEITGCRGTGMDNCNGTWIRW